MIEEKSTELATRCPTCGEAVRVKMVDGCLVDVKDDQRPIQGEGGYYRHASCHLGVTEAPGK